jgi:hypothetical protein
MERLSGDLKSRIGNAAGLGGIPLLQNLNADLSEENQRQLNETIQNIYTHFGVTKEEQKLPLKNLKGLLKRRYTERIKRNHPDKGGEKEVFERTQELYKAAKDILLTQGQNVDVDDDE